MARFWIGTSGWHYGHWRGAFYPQGLPPRQWLAFYAARFPTVELNASFYRQPRATTWDLWRNTAPQGFLFAVKANRFITHIKRLADCEGPLQRFLDGARRLGDRLGPVLYQMPPSFHRSEENVERLEAFLPLLPPDLLHAFEFRHKSWFGDDTAEQLRRHGIAFCSFDMVGFECPLAATAPYAYLRFHGSEARYASNYTDGMLEGWAARLNHLGREVDQVFVYFNNDAWAFAVANAARLAELLGVALGSSA
ncbi:MAG TPA: DUF72 domain-containing protein [Dehalococcoidia bacterium]|nr:DUF72 domain-containing protein [Dehalococcoidia bacterium]